MALERQIRQRSRLNVRLERALLIRSVSKSNKNRYLYIREILVTRIPGKRSRLSRVNRSRNLVEATNRTMAKRLMVPLKTKDKNTIRPLGCMMDNIAATRTKGSNSNKRFVITPIGSLDETRRPINSVAMIAYPCQQDRGRATATIIVVITKVNLSEAGSPFRKLWLSMYGSETCKVEL